MSHVDRKIASTWSISPVRSSSSTPSKAIGEKWCSAPAKHLELVALRVDPEIGAPGFAHDARPHAVQTLHEHELRAHDARIGNRVQVAVADREERAVPRVLSSVDARVPPARGRAPSPRVHAARPDPVREPLLHRAAGQRGERSLACRGRCRPSASAEPHANVRGVATLLPRDGRSSPPGWRGVRPALPSLPGCGPTASRAETAPRADYALRAGARP